MIRRLLFALALLATGSLATPAAAELPAPVRAMIEAAFRDNDPAAIAAVIKLAKETNPEDAAEIDAMTNARLQRLAAAQAAQREGQSFLDLVHGNVEFGASRTTGNYESFGAYGSVQLTQSSPHWQHNLNARADYLRAGGLTSTDRIAVAYQIDRKFGEKRYIYGLAEYERDPILGFYARYTGGVGIGYTLLNRPGLRVDLTGGPAIRYTDYVPPVIDPTMPQPGDSVPGAATTLAARASLSTHWDLSPNITFTQDAAAYVEKGDQNATANVGLETPLIGKLKAKLSYSIQYESDPPTGTKSLDTISRATLLYAF